MANGYKKHYMNLLGLLSQIGRIIQQP